MIRPAWVLWTSIACLLSVFALACSGDECVDTRATLCGRACFDLRTDPQNCGGCGVACGESEVCGAGACVCAPTAFEYDGRCYDPATSAMRLCDGVLVDANTDEAHCGSCERACGESESCRAGVCDCDANTLRCGGAACLDRSSDPLHCGACGNVCGAGYRCVERACVCDASTTECPGDTGCFDLQTADAHCGSCATSCDPTRACAARAVRGWVHRLHDEPRALRRMPRAL
jgi:hypothetical protein